LASILQNFWLPNATTWFYFSLVLAVALFFKFSRLLSVRNVDVLTMFLLMPGVLLIEHAQSTPTQKASIAVASLVGAAGTAGGLPVTGGTGAITVAWSAQTCSADWPSRSTLKFGYIWLLCGSAYFLVRCLLDLALVQRPALTPNLNFGGLAWMAGTLLVCLTAVAFRSDGVHQQNESAAGPAPNVRDSVADKVGRESAALEIGQRSLGAWTRRAMAVVCHLIVCIGLVLFCKLHFQDGLAGMAAATFYMLLPYTGHYVPHLAHVWPSALVVWALVAYRQPLLSGTLLGLAAGTIYFPALLLPLWLSFYRGRGVGRFALGFFGTAGLALGLTGLILLWSDDLGNTIADAIRSSDWQPWIRPQAEGIWQGIHWAYRFPIFVIYLTFVCVTAFWPNPKNLGHVLALSAAVFIGVQFWYADKGGQYILWYLPFLLLVVFRPNLSEHRPLPIVAETDWMRRLVGRASRATVWLLKAPEPLVRAR
jgi:hypothetical protein